MEELTMEEKQEFLERMREMIMTDILNREDRRQIYIVCLAACGREMGKLRKEREP